MNVIFAGTPEFARVALAALHAAGCDIRLVLSQPDRPAGRGMKLHPSPVKQFALDHGIAVEQPRSLRLDGKYPQDAAAAQAAIANAQADVMVVAAYGLILPQWVLDLMATTSSSKDNGKPGLGCINIHASILPRWRGAAPIHRAIEAGDPETGITVMQMDAGLDTGAMLLTERLPIALDDTTVSLHDKLSALGGRMVVNVLARAAQAGHGGLVAVPQPDAGITYAHKIDKAEAAIDWRQPAGVIARRIRAFDPFPGASTLLGGEVIKLWRSEVNSIKNNPDDGVGLVVSVDLHGIHVQCGQGVLCITELQRAGGKRMSATDFARGCAVEAGQVLGQISGQLPGHATTTSGAASQAGR